MDNEYNYDDWAELLCAFFFDEAHEGDEVLFAVDEAALAEASGLDEAEACESLAAAVRLVVGPGWNVSAIRRLVASWRRERAAGPHPAVPFLALTVLAAYRMGSYEGYPPHNYYVPLRRTLNPTDLGEGTPGTYLECVRALWDDVAQWATMSRRTQLTIRDPGWQFGRGLALQHALVKSSDLRQLDAFFRRIGLAPGETVAAAELLRALAAWTRRRLEPWARRLHRIATDAELTEYAEALLERQALRWDGRPRDPRTGRPVGRVRLGFASIRRPVVGVYLQWDERLPEQAAVVFPDGSSLDLVREHGWYAPHPVENLDVSRTLTEGIQLRGDNIRFDLRGEQTYAFAYDDDLGEWVSVDTMSYGDRYHLIVRRDQLSGVLDFARAVSSVQASVDDSASRLVPAGWCLVTNVQLDARPTIAPPPAMETLIPAGGGPRLRMLGGLPLRSIPGVYLRGGEPVLALSTISEEDLLEVRQRSTNHVERFRADRNAADEFPLWQLRLEPDVYLISHGGSTVTMEIVDGIADAAGPGAGGVRYRGRGCEVVGTESLPPTSGRRPITVHAPPPGGRVVLLGSRPGEQLIVKRPDWMQARAGLLTWRTIDAWVDFNPVWHFRPANGGQYYASLIGSAEPPAAAADPTGLWAGLIRKAQLLALAPPETEELWAQYREAAGVTSDG